MILPKGIVDPKINVFWTKDWEEQGYGLTQGRQDQLQKLFTFDVQTIRSKKIDFDGSYVAFIGIRWGFAKLFHGILIKTEIWENRGRYDIYGKLKT
jgi:hypothetical protein